MSKRDALARKRAALAAKRNRLSGDKKDQLQARLASSGQQLITPRKDTDPAPLSFSQQGLWLLDRLYPDQSAFHIPLAFRFTGKLDKPALKTSLRKVIARHEILRSTLQPTDTVPVWRVCEASEIEIEEQSISGPDGEKRLMDACHQQATAPFDLQKGPLFRLILFTLAEDDHVLMMTKHHIISDGWSMSVFMAEVARFYVQIESGTDFNPPKPSLQFGDYAVWQRNWVQSETGRKQLDWWRDRLKDAPSSLDLPTDFPRPQTRSFEGDRVFVELDPSLSAAVTALSRQEDVSLYMLLLATLHVLLHRITNQTAIVTGTQVANREREETAQLTGFLANTLPIRTDPSDALSFREYLAQVKSQCLDVFSRQELPFEVILEELPPMRTLDRPPVFQVMFNLQNFPRAQMPGHQLQLSRLPLEWPAARYDLALVLSERASQIAGTLNFNTALFKKETIEAMAANFQDLLTQFCQDPTITLNAITLGPSPFTGTKQATPANASVSPSQSPELVEVLSGLVGAVLSQDGIAPQDNLFDRGLHSKQAVLLADRISGQFGLDFPIQFIYQNPTIAGLATWIAQHHQGEAP